MKTTNTPSLEDVLAHCSAIAQDPKKLENYIIQCITDNIIDCDTASQIWKAFWDSQGKAAPAAPESGAPQPEPIPEPVDLPEPEVFSEPDLPADPMPEALPNFPVPPFFPEQPEPVPAPEIPVCAEVPAVPETPEIPEIPAAPVSPGLDVYSETSVVVQALTSFTLPEDPMPAPLVPETNRSDSKETDPAGSRKPPVTKSPFLKIILAILLTIAVFAGIFLAPYLAGLRAYKKGDYQTAFEKLEGRSGEKARQMYADSATQLGQQALDAGSYKEAADYFACCEPEAHEQWLEAISLYAMEQAAGGNPDTAREILDTLPEGDRSSDHADGIRITLAEQAVANATPGDGMKRWQEAKAYADQIFQTKPDPRVRTFYDRYYFALGLDRLSAGDTGKSREAFKKVTDSKIANTFVTALQKIDARDYTEAMELLDQLHKTNPTYQYTYGEEVPFSCPWDAWEAIIRSELESAYSLSYRLDVEKAALYLTTRQWETKQTTAALSGIQLSDITVQRNGSSLEDLNADTSIEITDTLNDLYKQCGTDPQGKILVLRKAKELYDESLTIALEMMQQLPYEYFPEDLSQVEYIILLDYSFWKTGYYNNFWGGRIHAVKEQCTVKVLQMPTRQQIYSGGTLTGGDPPQSIRVGMNNNPSFVSGGAPTLDEKLTGALKAIETKIAAKK